MADLPVFPLPGVVLFPGALLPLHVFEPRYRAMLQDTLDAHGALALAQLLEGTDEWGQPRFAEIAGGGIVASHDPLADGRSNIVVLGQGRLRLREIPPDGTFPYRRAMASALESFPIPVSESSRTALLSAATMFAGEVKRHDPSFSFQVPASDDGGELADACAGQLIVDPEVRQAVLEELDPERRVDLVLRELARQHGSMLESRPASDLN